MMSVPALIGRACRMAALFFITLGLACAAGCGSAPGEACLACHGGLEHASLTHGSCVGCHGGDPVSRDKQTAHAAMHGRGNPSGPGTWEEACGRCHRYQLERVR